MQENTFGNKHPGIQCCKCKGRVIDRGMHMTVRAIAQGIPADVALGMFGAHGMLENEGIIDALADDPLFLILEQLKYQDLIDIFRSQLTQYGGVHGDGRNLPKYASPNGEEDPNGEWFAPPSARGIRGRWVTRIKSFSPQDLARDLQKSQQVKLAERVRLYILLVLGWCSGLRVLDLHDAGLPWETTRLLSQIEATTLQNLETLKLEGNKMRDHHAADLVAKTVNLQYLSFSSQVGSGLDRTENGPLSFIRNVGKLAQLKVLNLTGGFMVDPNPEFEELGMSIHKLSKLEELNLSWEVDTKQLNYLLSHLPPSIRILDLSYVNDKTLYTEIPPPSTETPVPVREDININIDVEGVNLPVLHSLLLHRCTIDVKNLQKLIGLCGNRLKKLAVRLAYIPDVLDFGNRVEKRDRTYLNSSVWTKIVGSMSSSRTAIQEVDFTRLKMSDEQGSILLNHLRTCPNIRDINLSHNSLGALSVGVLKMHGFPKIQKLNLSCNKEMHRAKETLVKTISKNYASFLTYLRLDDIELDDWCVRSLARNPFPNLEELSLWKCGSLSRVGLITLLNSLGKGLLHLRLGIVNKRYDATSVNQGSMDKVMKNLNLSNIFQDADGQFFSHEQRLPAGLLTLMVSGFSMDDNMVGFAQRLPKTLTDLRICNSIVILPSIRYTSPVNFAFRVATRYQVFLQSFPAGLREFHMTPAGYFYEVLNVVHEDLDFQVWSGCYYKPSAGYGSNFLKVFEECISQLWLEMGRNVEVSVTDPRHFFA